MSHAKPSDQGIDGAHLDAAAAAGIAQGSCLDMVLSVRNEERQRTKPGDDAVAGARPSNPLEQLLQDEARREDDFAVAQAPGEECNVGTGAWRVSPKRERPHTRVHEDVHVLARSAL